jgi:phosphatidylglycerol:prolipoprotein diacylglycerol transferase
MCLLGVYVHNIDPIIGTVGGFHLWWYGLSYSLGFLSIHFWLLRTRDRLGFSTRAVYDLTILVALGVLVGARFVEVAFYEWSFYGRHPHLIPAYWLGGMSTHGVVFGGVAGIAAFCLIYRERFLVVADALMVPAALTLGLARIGNFIDGQIVGDLTDGWWGVKFPDAEGFRHPVVLYDGIKNLLLIPLLLAVGKRRPPTGVVTALFLGLYALLRIPVDVFREYRTTLLGLGAGQILNILLALLGLCLLVWCLRRQRGIEEVPRAERQRAAGSVSAPRLLWRKSVLALLVLFSLTMPSDWTQDVPARYGERHPGLHYSALYPRIDAMRDQIRGAQPD